MPRKRMCIDERYAYLSIQYERYVAASRQERSALLTEMAEVTGLHRKALIRLMRSEPKRHRRRTGRKRSYGAKVEQVVRVVDAALDHPCRERLTPMLPTMADHLQSLGRLSVSAETRELLGTISVSTVGRILRRIRQDEPHLSRRDYARGISRIQAQVPIRKIEWYTSTPGHFEVDLVFHSGPYASGEFVYTLQMVDVATGWSELAAVLGRSYRVIEDAFQRCLSRLPFPVLEIHTDNGSEFLNAHMLRFWKEKYQGVFLSRTRPYHSQDNRFVEHRNGALVRALVGHDRLDTAEQTRHLNRLYDIVWSYFNFFQPVMRLTSKTYADGRTRRKHDDVRTPMQRLCQSDVVSPDTIDRFRQDFRGADPFILLEAIGSQLDQLFRFPCATPGHTEDIFETLDYDTVTRKEEALPR